MSTAMDYQQRHLVKMANQIAGNIPVRADVPGQICAHMRQFWTPVMQKSLRHIAAETPDSLCLEVHTALENL